MERLLDRVKEGRKEERKEPEDKMSLKSLHWVNILSKVAKKYETNGLLKVKIV